MQIILQKIGIKLSLECKKRIWHSRERSRIRNSDVAFERPFGQLATVCEEAGSIRCSKGQKFYSDLIQHAMNSDFECLVFKPIFLHNLMNLMLINGLSKIHKSRGRRSKISQKSDTFYLNGPLLRIITQ